VLPTLARYGIAEVAQQRKPGVAPFARSTEPIGTQRLYVASGTGEIVVENRYRDVAIEASRAGGRVLQEWASRFTVKEKGPANLVTEADFASQETIVGLIRSNFPDHGFLGEEGLDQAADEQPFRWIIDPLDWNTPAKCSSA
jgi:hypothetical protein